MTGFNLPLPLALMTASRPLSAACAFVVSLGTPILILKPKNGVGEVGARSCAALLVCSWCGALGVLRVANGVSSRMGSGAGALELYPLSRCEVKFKPPLTYNLKV